IEPMGNSISIDAVCELIRFTKLKIASGSSRKQRLIIIDDAGTMTVEAQNALLKLLEEPPEDMVFLLNVAILASLLPTVRSRSLAISIKQPARADLEKYFAAKGFGPKQMQSAYLMSGGLPGLMDALLKDDANHPLMQAASQARELLRAKTFGRLCAID